MTLPLEAPLENKLAPRRAILSTGLAIFAMFFGAGNIVYPLALGQLTQDKTAYGIFGMIITAVFVPLLGLISMILYQGNYQAFFQRIGRIPGFLMVVSILGLIGPFGGIPRCITISFSTLEASGFTAFKGINLLSFSSLICALLFLFTYKQRRILSLLGFVLTPLLLISLGLIVAFGFFGMPAVGSISETKGVIFTQGLLAGYNTLDLLAAFFFSSMVLLCLQKHQHHGKADPKRHLSTAVWGAFIAAFLLSLVYVCFAFVAAGFSTELQNIASDQLLGTLAHRLLGPNAGLVAALTVSFACFTTEVALTAIFASFLQKTLLREKISYPLALCITLALSLFVSTLQFSGISAFLVPIVRICYPALIVLSILNIAYKLKGFKPVKSFFYVTVAIAMGAYFLTN